jgi:hypothetical protein
LFLCSFRTFVQFSDTEPFPAIPWWKYGFYGTDDGA